VGARRHGGALPGQQVLAVLGDAPLGVAGNLRILLQGLQDGGLLDDGILAQEQELLEVGRDPPGEPGEDAARHVAAAQDGLEEHRVPGLFGEEGQHGLAGRALQEWPDDPEVDLEQVVFRTIGHLRVGPAGELDLERDQVLGRQREDAVGSEELKLTVPRADLLEQRGLAVSQGQRASFFAFRVSTVLRSISRSRTTSPSFFSSSRG
jgi:hypothetical protein